MQFSTMVSTLQQARLESAELERIGYDALFTNETKHDPFVLSALMAEKTNRVDIVTCIAVAFARTPMLAAHAAHDINSLSNGRFVLGLGSQIKPHVTRRFSMPWSHPAPRMKEFIQALHAIWDCWYEGKPLKFDGQFYTHTLTSPMFLPEDKSCGRPKVMLAAVGPEMTKVAAEVADGLLCHSFTTERYLRDVTVPSIERVLKENGRSRGNFRLVGMPLIALGENQKELDAGIAAAKKQIAFYASTPAYKPVLDCHGWGDIQPEMLRLSKLGEWEKMGAILREEILEEFCVIGTPTECAHKIKERYGKIFDQICGDASAGKRLPLPILKAMKC